MAAVRIFVALAVAAALGPPAAADDRASIVAEIDRLMAEEWRRAGVEPSERADDAEFLRRFYLDLAGRIPTVAEARAFLADVGPDKRARLVERLLASPDSSRRLAAYWTGFLLPRGVDLDRFGGTDEFEGWLRERFAAGTPYDALVRELLLAEGRVGERGPVLFYAALQLKPEELATNTARAFLGVRLDCAQCHDHPFDRWTQQDFWSYAAFFARISRPEAKMETVSPVLRVKDADSGDVTLPGMDDPVAPRYPRLALDGPSPVPLADDGPARRRKLADWITASDNPAFARSAVNRVWAMLFGRGLVDPPDDLGPKNPPVHPEVLDLLARDFAATGFDLRRLVAVLTATRAYHLSSRGPEGDAERLFARMPVKVLTAEQLLDALLTATRQRVDEVGAETRARFLASFRSPSEGVTEYRAGIPQVLTLMNGGLVGGTTDPDRNALLKSLTAPFLSDGDRVETLYLATLSRRPDAIERERVIGFVAARQDAAGKRQALGDLLWAILNSAEFSLNH